MYKLLIVDDNMRERNGVSNLKIWNELGFDEIHTAINGQDGYEKALEIKPVLVISDVSMPVMDGLVMARKILRSVPDAKFIFMSCFDDSEYIRSAIDLNAFAYMLKPINIDKLKECVIKILNISETEQIQKNKIAQMQDQIEKNLPIIKEQIVRDWFYGNIPDGKYENLSPLSLDIRRFYAVAGLQINNFDKLTENSDYKDKYLVINLIVSLLNNLQIDGFRCISFIHAKNEIGIMLYIDETENIDDATNVCIDVFEYIKTEMNEQLNIDVSLYIGGVSEFYEDVPNLFEAADKFMQNGICAKNNSIIFAKEVQIANDTFDYDISNLKNEIFTIIENGSTEDIEDFVKKYIPTDEMQSVLAVRRFVLTVITILQLVLYEMGENLNAIFDDEFFVWEKITRYDTIFEVRNLLKNILRFSVEYLQEKKGNRNLRLVNDIKKIVAEQYASLKSMEQIASQTYFSAVHANVIFKKQTGYTIFDYLTHYKIEQAKKMLATGNYKIYEVSDYLGYKSKNYFSTLFKEYTGVTPSQYRNSAVIEKKE